MAWALNVQLTPEGDDPIGQPTKPASVRTSAPNSIVLHLQRQRAVHDLDTDLGALGAGMLGDVRQRFGDDEVGGGLDRCREPLTRHIDVDWNPQSRREFRDACRQSASAEDARQDPMDESRNSGLACCAWSSASPTSPTA